MPGTKRKTEVKDKTESLADKLNRIPSESEAKEIQTASESESAEPAKSSKPAECSKSAESQEDIKAQNEAYYNALFDRWEASEFEPQDYMIDVPVDSLESCVGYSSLLRQMHRAFVKTVAYYRSEAGGSLSIEEARKAAFHACTNEEEAKKEFQQMMRQPLESLNFVDLMELHGFAPRVAEKFWENAKLEARSEFESGHLAANITLPVGYMKGLWNVARYLGVRESFLDDWNAHGGIEIALVDMLAQSWFQWQYWIEQTVLRSRTESRKEHHEYTKWKEWHGKTKENQSWKDGYWFPTYVSEQQDIEHAVQMADRLNRIFMRTLRQLRDLRRYAPVTINNPSQVNIAADGGQQINLTKPEDTAKEISS